MVRGRVQQKKQRMRKKQLRDMLHRKHEEVRSLISRELHRNQGVGTGEGALDIADHANLTLSTDVDLAAVNRWVEVRHQVENALQQVEAGRYGVCEDCGRGIQLKRLQSLPFASRCVGCQEALEGPTPWLRELPMPTSSSFRF